MPNRDLLYSPLAQRDLDEIFDYIATELENPSSAAGTVNAILDAAESLVDFPYTGSPVRGLPFAAEEYRFTNTRNYLIFYRVTDACIFVDRILYKRRDYIPLLGLQKNRELATIRRESGRSDLELRFGDEVLGEQPIQSLKARRNALGARRGGWEMDGRAFRDEGDFACIKSSYRHRPMPICSMPPSSSHTSLRTQPSGVLTNTCNSRFSALMCIAGREIYCLYVKYPRLCHLRFRGKTY